MADEAVKQFTTLLDNSILGRLERMRIASRRRLTNRAHGEHLSGKGGTSIEFSDFRDYVAGDDLRFVDWNIFSRLNRPYVKQYRYEEQMCIVIIIDASASMAFDGKFQRACQLAGAFALMGLFSLEPVSIYACGPSGSEPALCPPCTGRVNRGRVFTFLEGLKASGDSSIESAVEAVLRRHRGRGMAIVLSDFLTFGALGRPFNLLFSAGLEVCAIQILSPAEIDPELTGDLRFVDSETDQTLDISNVGELLSVYHDRRRELERELDEHCRRRRGRFLSTRSDDPIEWLLFDRLRRQGWVR
jgi:uncharacterized protein (DUF58 family)